MKRLLIFMMLFTSYVLSAAANTEAVSMVDYEQTWLDSEGTIALKNNTQDPIYNVVFRITYLDMQDNPLDYEDFDVEVSIDPGMTRKVNIDAYEHGRMYSYYLSGEAVPDGKRFKIRYELIDYNDGELATDSISGNHKISDNGNDKWNDYKITEWNKLTDEEKKFLGSALGIGALCMLGLGIYIGLYVLVAVMAQHRRRNVALWVLVALLATPIITIIILLAVGNAPFDQRNNQLF